MKFLPLSPAWKRHALPPFAQGGCGVALDRDGKRRRQRAFKVTCFELREREGALRIEDGAPMREAMVEVLQRRGGTLTASDLLDTARPRVSLPGERPIRCE